MKRRHISEEKVKQILNIKDFRQVSKEKIAKFVAMVPNLDREVVLKIIDQFPNFTSFADKVLVNLKEIIEVSMDKMEDSEKEVVRVYEKIIDELSYQLHQDDLSPEDRKEFIDRMIDLADKINDLHQDNRRFFADNMAGFARFGMGALALGLAVLGIKVFDGFDGD